MQDIYNFYTNIKCLYILKGHKNYLINLTFSSDSNFLVSSDYDTVKIWDLETGGLISSYKHYNTSSHFSMVVAPNFSTCLINRDEYIEVRDLLTGDTLEEFALEKTPQTMILSPNGQYLFIGESHEYEIMKNQNTILPASLKVINLQRKKEIWELGQHPSGITVLRVSPDGKYILSQDRIFSTVKVWNFPNKEEINSFRMPRGTWINPVVFDSEGVLITGGYRYESPKDRKRNSFKVWEVLSQRVIQTFSKQLGINDVSAPNVSDIIFSPDGKVLIGSKRFQNDITMWSVKTGKEICTLQGHKTHPYLAIAPNGRIIASCDGSNIRIWGLQIFNKQ